MRSSSKDFHCDSARDTTLTFPDAPQRAQETQGTSLVAAGLRRCTGFRQRQASDKPGIVCRTLARRTCPHDEDRLIIREETSRRSKVQLHETEQEVGTLQSRIVDDAVIERRRASITTAAGSLDISMGFETVVDVVLHGLHIAGMWISFLRHTPGSLLALSQIFLQGRRPFHRMLPHRLDAADRQPHDTASPHQDPTQHPEKGYDQRLTLTG